MILKELVVNFCVQFCIIQMIALHAFAKRETQIYPEEPGLPAAVLQRQCRADACPDSTEHCVAYNLFAVACPVSCILL